MISPHDTFLLFVPVAIVPVTYIHEETGGKVQYEKQTTAHLLFLVGPIRQNFRLQQQGT